MSRIEVKDFIDFIQPCSLKASSRLLLLRIDTFLCFSFQQPQSLPAILKLLVFGVPWQILRYLVSAAGSWHPFKAFTLQIMGFKYCLVLTVIYFFLIIEAWLSWFWVKNNTIMMVLLYAVMRPLSGVFRKCHNISKSIDVAFFCTFFCQKWLH